jgi:4-oxalmesaconate hydratase
VVTKSRPSLERYVNELGFVGCNLNSDPSGGHWTGLPFFWKMIELNVPAPIKRKWSS